MKKRMGIEQKQFFKHDLLCQNLVSPIFNLIEMARHYYSELFLYVLDLFLSNHKRLKETPKTSKSLPS